jgi:hypothetical protein
MAYYSAGITSQHSLSFIRSSRHLCVACLSLPAFTPILPLVAAHVTSYWWKWGPIWRVISLLRKNLAWLSWRPILISKRWISLSLLIRRSFWPLLIDYWLDKAMATFWVISSSRPTAGGATLSFACGTIWEPVVMAFITTFCFSIAVQISCVSDDDFAVVIALTNSFLLLSSFSASNRRLYLSVSRTRSS